MRLKLLPVPFLLVALTITFACGKSHTLQAVSLSPPALELSSHPPALLEPRLLTLDWPAFIRLGDVAVIRLTLLMDTTGIVISTESDGDIRKLPLSNVYDVYNIISEVKMDLPHAVVRPPGVISQPLRPGQNTIFIWDVRPEGVGQYRGTVWFSLRFVPRNLGDLPGVQTGEIPVAAMPVGFEVVSLAGITGGLARTLGIVGLFLGFMLALPFLIEGLSRSRKVTRKENPLKTKII